MKKFLLSVLAIIVVLVSAVACGDNNSDNGDNGDWVEVQSVTVNSETYASYISFYVSNWTEIELSEYQNAPDDKKIKDTLYDGESYVIDSRDFRVDRTSLDYYIQLYNEQTYYSIKQSTSNDKLLRTYQKGITTYAIRYVKVRYVNNTTLEVQYGDKPVTMRIINPTMCVITYFND